MEKEQAMKKKRDKFKPAVDKRVLLLLAGSMWIGVGSMLLSFSYAWLNEARSSGVFVLMASGIALALVIHHFGFLKIVDNNLARIMLIEGKGCLFSFMPWKSYLIVAAMVVMGVLLRHSPLPKPFLSILYTGIGLALILSSVRYLRVFLSQSRKNS